MSLIIIIIIIIENRISARDEEGPADCITIDEVAAALKKMKNIKPQACHG